MSEVENERFPDKFTYSTELGEEKEMHGADLMKGKVCPLLTITKQGGGKSTSCIGQECAFYCKKYVGEARRDEDGKIVPNPETGKPEIVEEYMLGRCAIYYLPQRFDEVMNQSANNSSSIMYAINNFARSFQGLVNAITGQRPSRPGDTL